MYKYIIVSYAVTSVIISTATYVVSSATYIFYKVTSKCISKLF